MQDERCQADLILGYARTDAEGVAAQVVQDRERVTRDRELTTQDPAEARTEATALSHSSQNDSMDMMELQIPGDYLRSDVFLALAGSGWKYLSRAIPHRVFRLR